ncbi:MAG TPA: hypothetical protein QF753_21115 [Victivallales bacterium]|nr:hypothetical protein [Victivallales bacterium]
MFDAGAGKIGSYDSCCWEVEGKGQFRALSGSNPFIGKMGEIENVKEFKIEVVCRIELVEKVVKAIMESHPYETPAYQIIEAFVL